jgi:hypothetical protein
MPAYWIRVELSKESVPLPEADYAALDRTMRRKGFGHELGKPHDPVPYDLPLGEYTGNSEYHIGPVENHVTQAIRTAIQPGQSYKVIVAELAEWRLGRGLRE